MYKYRTLDVYPIEAAITSSKLDTLRVAADPNLTVEGEYDIVKSPQLTEKVSKIIIKLYFFRNDKIHSNQNQGVTWAFVKIYSNLRTEFYLGCKAENSINILL